MYIDKNFITALKYDLPSGEPLQGENYFIARDIEFEFKKSGYSFYYDDLTREVVIAMIYTLNVKFFQRPQDNLYTCPKLGDKYSLPYWLYHEVYSRRDVYQGIMGDDFYTLVPRPSEIYDIPEELWSDLDDEHISFDEDDDYDAADKTQEDNPDIISEKNEETSLVLAATQNEVVPVDSSIGILWITRHSMFQNQYDELTRVYGKNVRMYWYQERVLNYKTIRKICKMYDISVLAVVLPDSLIIDLREKMPNNTKIIRARLVESADKSYKVLNYEGDIIGTSSVFINGFEEISGYRIVTKPIIEDVL